MPLDRLDTGREGTIDSSGSGFLGTTPRKTGGRPRKAKRPCQRDGCRNDGRRNVGGKFVCETHRKQYERDQDTGPLCSVRGCDGPVSLGKNRTRRYCSTHSIRYLTDKPRKLDAALAEVADRIGIDNASSINCWMEIGEVGRANVEVDNLRWLITRFLWTVHYGPIRGKLELHHVCGNSWCLNPSHCWPLTGPQNKRVEERLGDYKGQPLLSRFAPITESFDQWCRANRLDHGMIEAIDSGARHYVEVQ